MLPAVRSSSRLELDPSRRGALSVLVLARPTARAEVPGPRRGGRRGRRVLAAGSGNAAQFLAGELKCLLVVGGQGGGQPGIGGGGVAAAGVLPAGHADHAGGWQQPAVAVQGHGGAVTATGGEGPPGGAQGAEGSRVVVALG